MRRAALLLVGVVLVGCESETGAPLNPMGAEDAEATVADQGFESAVDSGFAMDGSEPDGGFVIEDALAFPDATPPPDAGFVDVGFPPMTVFDPAMDGPFVVSQVVTSFTAVGTGNVVPLDCRFPGRSTRAYPLVMIGHGFQIPASQYAGYAARLASFGFVACTVDFEAGFIADHVDNAEDMIAAIDFMLAANQQPGGQLEALIDPSRIGTMGHSLGGKIAFMTADLDTRVGAVLGLDPVDGATLCAPGRCPDASGLLPFSIPIGVLGETIDGTGGLQACAPLAENFQTFYDAASTPAVEVEVLGANHISFIDDPSTCGLPCALCNPATASQPDVLALARAYTVAFFERYLKGSVAYDEYLTGMMARQRYEQTGVATIRSK